MTVRPTVRLRLTLAFGGLFLVAGGILLTLNYVFVRASLERDRVTARIATPVAGPGIVTEAPFPVVDEPLIIEGQPASVAEFARRVKDGTLDALVLQSAQTLALTAIAAVGVGWIVAGRVLKPVHDITAAARRLSQENLHERIDLDGPHDELKELADTFDAMLARLEAAFDSQRRFVANASHELRTPLSIIRTEIDVALADPDATPEDLRAMATNVRDATERSERLVDSLLVLARSDRGDTRAAGERVDLDAVAAEVVGQLGGEAEARPLEVRAEVQPGVAVTGDRQLIERLVANLVENAIRHNVRDGHGSVDVAVFARGSAAAVVRVANTGAPVPATEVDALFEPFRRLAPERTSGPDRRGVGLGLSIVRSVARAHGGHVTARARPEGGLEVEVELPIAPRSADDGRGGGADHG